MSNEEINRKIAEACGWKRAPKYDHATAILDKVEIWQKGETLKPHFKMPDYCSDLNAMHEAEKSIESLDWHTYTRHLRAIVQRDCNSEIHYVPGCERAQLIADFWFYRASAAQRAEAFLKTVAPKL